MNKTTLKLTQLALAVAALGVFGCADDEPMPVTTSQTTTSRHVETTPVVPVTPMVPASSSSSTTTTTSGY